MATSKEHYLKTLRERSVILNKNPDPQKGVKFNAIFGLGGLRNYYRELTEDTVRRGETILSHLNFAREQLEQARQSWDRFASTQVTKAEPSGDFLQQIQKREAKLQVLEEEQAEIERILKEVEEKQAIKRPLSKRQKRMRELQGRIINDVLVEFGGRPVKQVDGRNVFEDGTSVGEYIKKIKAARRKERRAAQRA
jgi:hypothetical protein